MHICLFGQDDIIKEFTYFEYICNKEDVKTSHFLLLILSIKSNHIITPPSKIFPPIFLEGGSFWIVVSKSDFNFEDHLFDTKIRPMTGRCNQMFTCAGDNSIPSIQIQAIGLSIYILHA